MDTDKKEIKKRGRKPKGGKIIDNKQITESVQLISQNIILHLKCSLQDISVCTPSIDIEPYISQNNEEIIRISPHLTEKILQNYINTSRQLIVQLYVDCEEDFLEGVKIYEALIENITFHTSLSQLEHLHEELINL